MQQPPHRADVLVIGAGPSGAIVAHTLATRGFSVVCLEQGDWVNPSDLPGEPSRMGIADPEGLAP